MELGTIYIRTSQNSGTISSLKSLASHSHQAVSPHSHNHPMTTMTQSQWPDLNDIESFIPPAFIPVGCTHSASRARPTAWPALPQPIPRQTASHVMFQNIRQVGKEAKLTLEICLRKIKIHPTCVTIDQ